MTTPETALAILAIAGACVLLPRSLGMRWNTLPFDPIPQPLRSKPKPKEKSPEPERPFWRWTCAPCGEGGTGRRDGGGEPPANTAPHTWLAALLHQQAQATPERCALTLEYVREEEGET